MKIFYASEFFIKSLLGERATGLFIVLAAIFVVLSLSLSDINISVKYRLLEDSLLASQGFIMTLAAIFYAFLSMEKERKGGIFVFGFVCGLKRGEYLISQFMSVFALIGAIFAIFFILDILFLSVFADGISTEFAKKLLFWALSSALLGFLTLALSRFVSNTNAVIYAIFLFFIGSSADELAIYAAQSKSPILSAVSAIVYYVLPNFSFFDSLSTAVSFSQTLFAIVYFVLYSGVLLLAARYKFRKEVLRVG